MMKAREEDGREEVLSFFGLYYKDLNKYDCQIRFYSGCRKWFLTILKDFVFKTLNCKVGNK
jgi:hypothetical protein